MPRDYSSRENERRARAMRESALARPELGQPTSPRVSAAGPISMAVKKVDEQTANLVRDFLEKRGTK